MTLSARGKAAATRLLRKHGQAANIRRTTNSGGGPSSLTPGTTTTTNYPCNAALFPVDQRDVDGALLKAGDWRALVTAIEGFTPTTTDKLVCSEGVLTIVDPGKFAPAGLVTHYEMIVRRA